MVTYKKIKDMWMVFNQWLKFMEKCYTLRTPGVGKEATRMKKRVGTYVEFLKVRRLTLRGAKRRSGNATITVAMSLHEKRSDEFCYLHH